jgi:hypothetical protein
MRWVGHAVCMGELGNSCKILVGKCERRRSHERSRCGWEDNIIMDIKLK